MTSMTSNPAVPSAARLAFCVAVAWMCLAQPVAAQVTDSPETIAAFLGGHALSATVLDEEISQSLLEMTQADFRSEWASMDPESSKMPDLDCFERWDTMGLEDRVACLRFGLGLSTAEWLPALGMLLLPPEQAITSYARAFPEPPRYLPRNWSVEQDDDRFFIRLGANDQAEINYFDGSRLTVDFQEIGPGLFFLSVAGPSDESGRDRDSALLVGEWVLDAVDDNSLRDFSPVTYALRGDGTFEISGSGDVGDGAAPNMAGALTEGLWGLSMSKVPPSRGQDPTARVLVLTSGEEDHADAHQVLLVEQLDDTTLVLAIEGGAGGPDGSKLHLRR